MHRSAASGGKLGQGVACSSRVGYGLWWHYRKVVLNQQGRKSLSGLLSDWVSES